MLLRHANAGQLRSCVTALIVYVLPSRVVIIGDLVLELEQLCGTLRVEHGCTLTKFADDRLERVLVHSLLLMQVV